MKYKREVTLQNGETLLLRSLGPQDAQETLRIIRKTAGETDFMMRYEDEWTVSIEQQRELLASMEHAPKALMLGAFLGGRLVGVGNFKPIHPADRARHRAGLGLSILKSHWGKGIGTAMMHAMLGAAKETPLELLELSVVGANTRAKAMYDHLGFIQYGRQPNAMKYRDGRYDDLILMQLDLHRDT